MGKYDFDNITNDESNKKTINRLIIDSKIFVDLVSVTSKEFLIQLINGAYEKGIVIKLKNINLDSIKLVFEGIVNFKDLLIEQFERAIKTIHTIKLDSTRTESLETIYDEISINVKEHTLGLIIKKKLLI
jgi:hypothetical protein